MSTVLIIFCILSAVTLSSAFIPNDLLDIISEMSETSFKDLEFEQLDKNQHHGRKAKADIQRESNENGTVFNIIINRKKNH